MASVWYFLVPLVLVLGTVIAIPDSDDFLNSQESSEIERCPEKERWDRCGATCQRNCSNVNENPGLCPRDNCKPGCVCIEGLVRGPRGKCIKPAECLVKPGSCPRGERWDRCGYKCQKDCSNWDKEIPCILICTPGCICIEGTVRSKLPFGRCIKPETCPKKSEEDSDEKPSKCPNGQHYDRCNYMCQKDCSNWDHQVIPCPKICAPGCLCDNGTVREKSPNGRCIKPDTCPPKSDSDEKAPKCPKGEHYDRCDYRCQKDCSNWDHPVIPCPKICAPGCLCDNGTVREKLPNGRCIKPDTCPPKSDSVSLGEEDWEEDDEEDDSTEESQGEFKNKRYCPRHEEFIACKAHCELNCKTRNESEPTCNGFCVSGCRCKPGYVRGPKGICIKPDACPAKDETIYPVERICPRREVWNKYVAHCQGNCSTDGKLIPCVRMAVAGCICKKGLFRREDGKCVSLKKCEKKEEVLREENFCPRNEEFVKCPPLLEADCGKTEGRSFPCVPGCRCKRGYVRGPKGTCIKREECPPKDPTRYPVKRECPENEEWGTSAHCQRNCTHPKERACPFIIVEGCVCKKEWLRRSDGKCVPEKECPKVEEGYFCPPNEEFVKCEALIEEDCGGTIPPRGLCVSGCRCQKGYVRGPKGTCIKKEKCPTEDPTKYPVKRECPKNEKWSNVAHCQENCTNPIVPCLRINVNGCVCIDGWYRRPNGLCVPRRQCFKKEEEEATATFCPKNEIFVSCYSHCEKDCSTKDKQVPECMRSVCVSACRCHWDYVRGPKGTCIKPQECPAKDGTKYPVKRVCPPKEHWEVSKAHCQINCTNYQKPPPCEKVQVAGCVCNAKLYRGKDGQCIPKNKCPKRADEFILNEEEGERDVIVNHDENEEDTNAEAVESRAVEVICPSQRKCIAFCRRYNFRRGRCVGLDNRRCYCYN